MTDETFAFEGRITRFGVGRSRVVWYTVLFLPEGLVDRLPFKAHPRLRVDGEVADIPVNGAFIPAGDGRYYVILGPPVLRRAGVGVGDRVEMRFRVADQDHVEVPDALAAALERDAAANARWQALTAGKRRGLAHRVASAATAPTRAKRVAEVLAALDPAP